MLRLYIFIVTAILLFNVGAQASESPLSNPEAYVGRWYLEYKKVVEQNNIKLVSELKADGTITTIFKIYDHKNVLKAEYKELGNWTVEASDKVSFNIYITGKVLEDKIDHYKTPRVGHFEVVKIDDKEFAYKEKAKKNDDQDAADVIYTAKKVDSSFKF